jgi:CheY-like chemotaxis protein
MRQLQREHGLKGLTLTGYGMSEDIARAESAGFVAHLTKPVDVRRLETTLARVIADHFVGERTG